MNGQPEFHPLADRELNEAAQYYELESPGLGSAFLKEVERCLRMIAIHPEAGIVLVGSVRRRLLRRFPYAILYRIKPEGIRIPGGHEPQTAPDVLGQAQIRSTQRLNRAGAGSDRRRAFGWQNADAGAPARQLNANLANAALRRWSLGILDVFD